MTCWTRVDRCSAVCDVGLYLFGRWTASSSAVWSDLRITLNSGSSGKTSTHVSEETLDPNSKSK